MLYIPTIISILEVLAITVPVLLTVAFITIAERKTMASMQRRVGPNSVGWYGLLQAFADALKLLLKEYVSPTQANIFLFFLGPIITLIFALLGYAVIPYGPGLMLLDYNLGILYLLAMSSLATYGILLAGWSANSKYAFLGSLRSTAQLISYELILSSAILLIVFLAGSLDVSVVIEAQRTIWYIIPLFPIFIIFFIGSIAETNRAPFDLAEAESELVSGFMTEHSAVIFVFFFLAEYASIILICILNSILFLGGYLLDFNYLLYPYIYILQYIQGDSYMYLTDNESNFNVIDFDNYSTILGSTTYGLVLGIKACIMIFTFIWARASFPRIRYDQLMSYCWTVLLPIVIAFIIIVPCIIYSFEILPVNISLLSLPFVVNKNLISSMFKYTSDNILPKPHSFANVPLQSANDSNLDAAVAAMSRKAEAFGDLFDGPSSEERVNMVKSDVPGGSNEQLKDFLDSGAVQEKQTVSNEAAGYVAEMEVVKAQCTPGSYNRQTMEDNIDVVKNMEELVHGDIDSCIDGAKDLIDNTFLLPVFGNSISFYIIRFSMLLYKDVGTRLILAYYYNSYKNILYFILISVLVAFFVFLVFC